MKETLRQRIELMKLGIEKRIEQLRIYQEEYIQEKYWEDAMKCDIKINTLLVVLENLEEVLK